jgi:hypothetical protein
LWTLVLILAAGAVVIAATGLVPLSEPTTTSSSPAPSARLAHAETRSSATSDSQALDTSAQVDYRTLITMEDVEEELPPIVLGSDSFSVVVHKKRLVWPEEARHRFDPDDDETAVSFDIRDAQGNVIHTYNVLDDPNEVELSRVRADGRFSFAYSVHPYLLEGSAGTALMVDWYFFPSAPNACGTHVILGIVDGELVPFVEPFCEILEQPRGQTADVWKLQRQDQTRDDVLVVRWSTGWFSVFIPVRVDFSSGKLLPSRRCLRMNEAAQWVELCEFPVEAHRTPGSEDTFVRLFPRPERGATPDHVVVKPDSEMEFLSALAPNLFDEHGKRRPLPWDEPLWLKVRIGNKVGWVLDGEDLRALGLFQVG